MGINGITEQKYNLIINTLSSNLIAEQTIVLFPLCAELYILKASKLFIGKNFPWSKSHCHRVLAYSELGGLK